jgi:hypothetical protein
MNRANNQKKDDKNWTFQYTRFKKLTPKQAHSFIKVSLNKLHNLPTLWDTLERRQTSLYCRPKKDSKLGKE